MTKHNFVPNFGTVRGAIMLLGLIAALIAGLVLTGGPVHGSGLAQGSGGDISGQVTLAGQPVPDIAVELRQRSNGGDDSLLVSARTDGSGTYHFAGQPSAPNDAFYYVRFLGGKGALSAWYSFPIIYIMSSDVSVPAVELADVELAEPAQNAAVKLPVTLKWKSRKMGETYRVFVYADGKTDKPVLDSGSLGTGTEYMLAEGSLPDGKYEALVQVRDTVVGYGQSQSRFHFVTGAAAPAAPATQSDPQQSTSAPPPGGVQVAPANPPAQQQGGTGVQVPEVKDQAKVEVNEEARQDSTGQPDVKLNLSSDKTTVGPGENITYKVEVENAGAGAANSLIITDKLPDGVSLSPEGVKSSAGKVSADAAGGTVTVSVDSLAAGEKATIEIPVSVKSGAGGNLSNQASAQYDGSQGAVQSNAYIAQVAAPLTGPSQGQSQQPAQQPASSQPSAPKGDSAQAPSSSKPAAAQPQQPAAAPKPKVEAGTQAGSSNAAPAAPQSKAPAKKSAASVPQTGGSFPVVLALVLLVMTLLARYLRGLKPRQL